MILEVLKDGAAAMSSLMPGDILVGFDNQHLDSIDDFKRALEGNGEGVIRLQLRGDRTTVRTVAVRLRLGNTVAA